MDEDIVDTLQGIGLTEYQSRAYVAAVSLGRTRLADLSEEADIPQQRIYDVVDDLQDRGLVEVHEGKNGKEAVAVPPDVGLAELKRQHIQQFTSDVESSIDDLTRRFDQVDTSAGFVTVVNHESSARRHMRNAIQSAEWWLFLSLPIDWYQSLEEDVRLAVDRGATVRLLVHSGDETSLENVSYPSDVLVRRRMSADNVVAADRKYGVFRGVASPAVTRPSLVTRDESMVEMFQRYSEQFWAASRGIRTEQSLPRRYLTPWVAITDNVDLLDSGDPVALTVEGHETNTGRMGTWEGTVLDYECEPDVDATDAVVLPEVARFTVETDDGRLTVGGWDATLEDVAAHGLELNRS